MLGISDLLNQDGSNESLKPRTPREKVPRAKGISKPAYHAEKLYRLRVHPKLLKGTKLVDIALRKKTLSRKGSNTESTGLKLHTKLLGAGLRVRLVLCPSIYDIYNRLTPITNRNYTLYKVKFDPALKTLVSDRIDVDETNSFMRRGEAISKRVRLIDNNLVNLSGISSKVLKALSDDKMTDSPEDDQNYITTFNELDTAIVSLFKQRKYTLVRVTRSASSNSEGSVLGKLESAKPGDVGLIDDKDFLEEMVAYLGCQKQVPNNLFIKKIVTRPRYKVDMKLYLIPFDQDVLIWADQRIFERDLVNGVIDMGLEPDRTMFTTFPPDQSLDKVRDLLARSSEMTDSDSEEIPNHMTKSLHRFFRVRNGSDSNSTDSPASSASLSSVFDSTKSEDSLSSGGRSSLSSVFDSNKSEDSLSSGGTSVEAEKVFRPSGGSDGLTKITNIKAELSEPKDLDFDTGYMA